MKNTLTYEKKAKIEELFKAGMKNAKIAEEVECSPQTVANHLDRIGLKPIRHFAGTAKASGSKSKVCPKCRATGHQKGARYCFRCGQDIRGEEIILNEKLQRLLGNVKFLPENCRDEVNNTIQEVMRYLEKQGA